MVASWLNYGHSHSYAKKYPAYIVAPQFPQRSSNYIPDGNKKVLVSSPAPCLSTALQLIDSLKQALPIDERKIYVIGFSMGASSVINALGLRSGLFTAAISISGIPTFPQPAVILRIPPRKPHYSKPASE